MKADLVKREPERLRWWRERGLYRKLRAARSGRQVWLLHDGPPYSNAHLHLGTAANKIWKDAAVRSASARGLDSPYVPGWDNHGMPIETEVGKQLRSEGVDADRLTLRRTIALIPIPILLLAYAHNIPIPPELMLLGDLLAYIDIFSVIFLLSIMSRVENVVFILKQAAAHAIRLANNLLAVTKRLDFRNRREGGARTRKGASGRACSKDDDHPAIHGVAWA